jgi:hypothetical protein
MFATFDDVRDFALTFVDKLVESGHIPSDIDTENETELEIQDDLIEHFLERFKEEDCLIPDGGEAYEIVDYNTDYMVAFISSGEIPLGIFVIFTDEIEDEEDRLYVSINHSVVYLDSQQYDIS